MVKTKYLWFTSTKIWIYVCLIWKLLLLSSIHTSCLNWVFMAVRNTFNQVISKREVSIKNVHKHKEVTAKEGSSHRAQGKWGHSSGTKAYSWSNKALCGWLHLMLLVDGAYWFSFSWGAVYWFFHTFVGLLYNSADF